jgi:amino acid transporter
VHTISFRGLAGSIFVCLCLAAILYIIGFATTAWSITQTQRGEHHEGLWESCYCGSNRHLQDWFKATQALITIGLIGLFVALVLACIYLCIHSVSKNTTILALVIVCFVSVLFMVIGFAVYGSKRSDLHWSFAVTVIASVLCLVAGILSIVQMRQSGVRV